MSEKRTNDLSLKMAKESLTLLNYMNALLPLTEKSIKIAAIGLHGNSIRSYFGTFSYEGVLEMNHFRSEVDHTQYDSNLIMYNIFVNYPGEIQQNISRIEKEICRVYPESRILVDAIQDRVPESEVVYSQGCSSSGNDLPFVNQTLNTATGADVIILTLGGKNGGGSTLTIGEGIDLTNIGLPGSQEQFARAVYALGIKTAVVHFDGLPLSSEFVASQFDAILEAWQPGQYGGKAIAPVLFGDYYPAGRLTMATTRNSGQLPVYYNMSRGGSGFRSTGQTSMIVNTNGYINQTAKPLFYFGHGLSYTEYTYSNLILSEETVKPEGDITVSMDIANTGSCNDDEVIQLYISDSFSSIVRPEMELVGFKRVYIESAKKKTLRFTFKFSHLAYLDNKMNWKVEKGAVLVMAEASSQDIKLTNKCTIEKDLYIVPKNRDGGVISKCL